MFSASASVLAALLPAQLPAQSAPPVGDGEAGGPVPVVFDTDLGNDCDDVLALGMLHALADRGECDLLCVTTSKAHRLSAPFADLLNTFYGRPEVPVGACSIGGELAGPKPHEGRYLRLAEARTAGGARVYPHDLPHDPAAVPDAVPVLRRALAGAADGMAVVVQVGFSTNLARLLDSPADDLSPLTGRELVKRKVDRLVLMAGAFEPIRDASGDLRPHREFNVAVDVPSCRKLAAEWPTPMLWSGFEIGLAVPYPAASVERDYRYAARHPLPEAYQLYEPTPHERPTWDLTAALHAVRPGRGYFGLSEPGHVTVADDGVTTFAPDPAGSHRYLMLPAGAGDRVAATFAALCSQPPVRRPPRDGATGAAADR